MANKRINETAHDVIYLQVGDSDEPIGIDYTTWCSDKINDGDVKYLLATSEREAASELYEALVNADYAVWYMANNGLEDMIDWEERFNQLTEAIALIKGE